MGYSVGRFMKLLEGKGGDVALRYYHRKVGGVGFFGYDDTQRAVDSVNTISRLERAYANLGVNFRVSGDVSPGTSAECLDHVVGNLAAVADLDNGRGSALEKV